MKARKIIPRESVTTPTPENVFIGGNWHGFVYTGTILNVNVEGVPVYQPTYSDGVVINKAPEQPKVYGDVSDSYLSINDELVDWGAPL